MNIVIFLLVLSTRTGGFINIRIQPLITQPPRTNFANQFANQLAGDGATGLNANQLDGDDLGEGSGEGSADGINDVSDEADDGKRVFKFAGREGECRVNSDCKGSERCIRLNGFFM